MQEVSVIIPNYNGMAYLEGVLSSLEQQAFQNFETILVDNGSSDGSVAFVMGNFPWVHIVELPDNFGFSRAVNEGIYASLTPYVLLLNNDTEVDKNFVGEMLAAIKRHKKAFSCSARMICYHDRDKLDDAGNYYSALGWAYARGKGKDIHSFEKEGRIFTSCAGAAIYRKKVFEKIGYFDEEHFAYLEDLDVCYRARIMGYENWYAPKAVVYHVGSGTSGSRYNAFKVRLAARNNVYLLYKNMRLWQLVLNGPFLLAGMAVKYLFFKNMGYGKEYMSSLMEGFHTAGRQKRVPSGPGRFRRELAIQLELMAGTAVYVYELFRRRTARAGRIGTCGEPEASSSKAAWRPALQGAEDGRNDKNSGKDQESGAPGRESL